jgi:hypothetical protein
MKSIIVTFTIAALTLIGSVTPADARHSHSSRTYISGYRSCGTPIYTERYFVGYDRCGAPVWGYRIVRSSYYRPVVRARSQAPCPPPVYYGHRGGYRRDYSGGRVVIQGSICR